MNPEPFRFKQFHVHHHLCAHKVGTDGVLLGAWADHPSPKQILDVGSGSGLISFMLAQRFPKTTFVGIEQHGPSINQARQSLAEGPFAHRGEFIQADFLQWNTHEKFDFIVSNPPFFEKAQQTAKAERDAARRQFNLPHHLMLKRMVSLLQADGKIALVLPTSEAQVLTTEAEKIGLSLNRKCAVKSFPHTKVIRHLLEFSAHSHPLQQDELAIRNEDRGWSNDYRELTAAFYL